MSICVVNTTTLSTNTAAVVAIQLSLHEKEAIQLKSHDNETLDTLLINSWYSSFGTSD